LPQETKNNFVSYLMLLLAEFSPGLINYSLLDFTTKKALIRIPNSNKAFNRVNFAYRVDEIQVNRRLSCELFHLPKLS